MFNLAKTLYEAFGIESPRLFALVLAIIGFFLFGGFGVILDRAYQNTLRERQAASNQSGPTSPAPLPSDSTSSPVKADTTPAINPTPPKLNLGKPVLPSRASSMTDKLNDKSGDTFHQINQPGSLGVQGSGNKITVNPPVNAYAPVVTWDFNGGKRTTAPGRTNLQVGDELAVFQRLIKLNEDKDWATLAMEGEAQIAKTPDWLTPYLLAGIAHLNRQEQARGIECLEFVADRSGGDPQYADALRILKQLGRR